MSRECPKSPDGKHQYTYSNKCIWCEEVGREKIPPPTRGRGRGLRPRDFDLENFITSNINQISSKLNISAPHWDYTSYLRTERWAVYVAPMNYIVFDILLWDLWQLDEEQTKKGLTWIVAHELFHAKQAQKGMIPSTYRQRKLKIQKIEEEAEKFAEEYTGIKEQEFNTMMNKIISLGLPYRELPQ